MPKAIGKGIVSDIFLIKADATEPAKKELDQPICRWEARTTKSFEISIGQEAVHRKKRK